MESPDIFKTVQLDPWEKGKITGSVPSTSRKGMGTGGCAHLGALYRLRNDFRSHGGVVITKKILFGQFWGRTYRFVRWRRMCLSNIAGDLETCLQ